MTTPEQMDVAESADDFDDFDDVEDELDETFGSPATLILLLLLGIGVGVLFYGFTRGSMILFDRWVEGLGWVIAPAPLMVFGILSFWLSERGWLQQAGAVAVGLSLANFVMMAIETSTSA